MEEKKYPRRTILGAIAASPLIIKNKDHISINQEPRQEDEAQFKVTETKHRLFVPGVSTGENKQALEVPPSFKWKRSEILFGQMAGFQELREGEMVSVYINPSLSQYIDEQAVAPWNALGVELRGKPYFELSSDPLSQIQFLPNEKATWVQPFDVLGKHNNNGPFDKAIVHSFSSNTNLMNNLMASHELGHAAFGFVDFFSKDTYERIKTEGLRGYVNPQNGGDPERPYEGVMNYVNWTEDSKWFGQDDKYMLITGGFV